MKFSLRALRVNAGLSRADVADKIGLTPTGYRRIETADGAGIKVKQFKKICDLYGVNPENIYLQDETENTNDRKEDKDGDNSRDNI